MGLTINEMIKDLRVVRMNNMKQEEFAEKLGIPQSTYERYEKDGVSVPAEIVAKIAKLCNVSADYIVGLSENENTINVDIKNLHLTNEAITTLKENKFDSLLFSEMISNDNFKNFMIDLGIYVYGNIEVDLQNYNVYINSQRLVIETNGKNIPKEEMIKLTREYELRQAAQKDFFRDIFANDTLAFANNLRKRHIERANVVPGILSMEKLLDLAEEIAKNPNSLQNPIALKDSILDISEDSLRNNNVDEESIEKINLLASKALDGSLWDSPIVEPDSKKRRDKKNKQNNNKTQN